jgi:hypothetical protein
MCRPTCIVWANPRPCSLQAAVEGATAQRLRLEAAAAAETATEEGQLHRHTELVCRLEDALCFLKVWSTQRLNWPIVTRAGVPRQVQWLIALSDIPEQLKEYGLPMRHRKVSKAPSLPRSWANCSL